MNYAFKMVAVVLALGVLVLQGCQTSVYSSKTTLIASNMPDRRLCNFAVFGDDWDKNPKNQKYVIEAKKRNLDCNSVKAKSNFSGNYATLKGGISNILISSKEEQKNLRIAKQKNSNPAISQYDDDYVCDMATITKNGKKQWIYSVHLNLRTWKDIALERNLNCLDKTPITNKIISSSPIANILSNKIVKDTKTNSSNEKEIIAKYEIKSKQLEKEKRIEQSKRKELEKKLAALQSEKKKQIKKAKQNEIGSGFYVSKFRHLITNQHVVNQCKKITVGDSISNQIPATLVASDKRNDLAILQTISMEMASADTKSFIQNLSIEIVPIVSGGLIRAEDVIGGEEIFVAGYPLGNIVSDSMRLVPGLVNATKGYENDITQFETDASIKKGNSGGPIYDKRGNIVGVAVKRLNVSQSDNFNFAIKGTTVKQFLDANGVITSLANRTSQMSSTDIYKIASKQTVMVVCHR